MNGPSNGKLITLHFNSLRGECPFKIVGGEVKSPVRDDESIHTFRGVGYVDEINVSQDRGGVKKTVVYVKTYVPAI